MDSQTLSAPFGSDEDGGGPIVLTRRARRLLPYHVTALASYVINHMIASAGDPPLQVLGLKECPTPLEPLVSHPLRCSVVRLLPIFESVRGRRPDL